MCYTKNLKQYDDVSCKQIDFPHPFNRTISLSVIKMKISDGYNESVN